MSNGRLPSPNGRLPSPNSMTVPPLNLMNNGRSSPHISPRNTPQKDQQEPPKLTEFRNLLVQLNRQHEQDVATASYVMQEENIQLRSEISRLTQELKQLRKGKQVVIDGPRKAAHFVEAPPIPSLPNTLPIMQPSEIVVNDYNSSPPASQKAPSPPSSPPLLSVSEGAKQPSFINGLRVVTADLHDTQDSSSHSHKLSCWPGSPTSMTKEIEGNERKNELRRFKKILESQWQESGRVFHLQKSGNASRMTFNNEDLRLMLEQRGKIYTNEEVKAVMEALLETADRHLHKRNPSKERFKDAGSRDSEGSKSRVANEFSGSERCSMLLTTLVDLLMMRDLKNLVNEMFADKVADIQTTLTFKHTTELFRVTKRMTPHNSGLLLKGVGGPTVSHLAQYIMPPLNVVVFLAIWASLLILGFSLDNDPEGVQWNILEGILCFIFVSEVVVKNVLFGVMQYFCGEDRYFNWLDTFLTGVSTCDVFFAIALESSSQEKKTFTNSKLAFVLRVLRLARLGRLTKLLKYPIFKEMLNMLAGLMLGIPSLLWVLVLLLFIVYVTGIVFRQIVGPKHGDPDLVTLCGGSADVLSDADLLVDPQCKRYKLYGEEFFGSVTMSMFTVFRCMIGDCSTKGGQSLVVHFSDGYGTRFNCVYAVSMIIVIFGIFNTITSVFVEATLSGLKYNDDKRRYQRTFAVAYTNKKLKELVMRLDMLKEQFEMRPELGIDPDLNELQLTEEDFVIVMEDETIANLLDDLDIPSFNRAGLFELFDVDGTGEVTIPEFLRTLMRLRGDPQKSDGVATWVTLCSVRDRLEDFKKVLLDNQKLILQQQRKMLETVGA